MFQRSKLSKIALAVAMSVGISTSAMATVGQSSTVRGTIETPAGQPAVGSTITIIHQPSGTTKELTVNEEGGFSARGLRPGGPYQIIVTNDNYEAQIFNDIYLEVNDPLELDTQLADASDLETIVVTGSASFLLNNGSSSVFSGDQILKGNTFDRDFKDIVRLNPLAVVSPNGTELSIAGSNPRFNSLTIDGVGVNDTFGLNASGYPSARQPISLDAVEQVSIDFAPFNARVSEFSGGIINAVTKSGTNEFHGTAFYEETPNSGTARDDMLNPGQVNEFDVDTNETTYGFSVGGPILQDKLFFFANYEYWEDEIISNFNLNDLSGSGHRVSNDQVNQVIGILNDVYGIQDSLGGTGLAQEDEKFLVKLDWNISADHRAALTYSYQEGSAPRNFTTDNDEVNLASNFWSQDTETTLIVGQVYSDWSSDFTTEVSFSYQDFEQLSNTASQLGEINVDVDGDTIVAGRDEARHANELANETLSFNVHATYLMGDTEFRAGVEYDSIENFNIFGRDSAGTWSFDSIEDFANRAPSRLEYASSFTGNIRDIAYDVDNEQFAVYADANFDLFDGFNVTAGARYERISVDGSPRLNQNFVNTYGYANTENLDGLDIFLPRVGFTWDYNEDLIIRGGLGRFAGGQPLVWAANAYTRDGVTNVNAPGSVTNAAIQNPDNVDFTTVPVEVQNSLVQGAGSTNTIDRDFEQPSEWRYQIAADYTFSVDGLGDDFLWSNELTYVDRKDQAFWRDISRVPNGQTVDGRTIWTSVYDDPDLQGNWDLELTNADGGRSIIFITSLNKAWDNGISLSTSYTHQDIEQHNPGTSSTAESNFQFDVLRERNTPTVGTANFEIEHRFVINLAYDTEFFEGYSTSFNLFWERRSGEPVSFVLGAFRDNDFGDQAEFDDSDIYLPYIPTGPNDAAVDFVNGMSYDQFLAIAQAAGVDGYAGGYVPKNSVTQPWLTQMDFAINQEIPGFVEGHKGLVYLNIDNFANLLNDDWGRSYNMRFPQQILVDYDINEQGQYVYQERFGGTDVRNFNQFDIEESTWRIKVGVRYTF